MIARIPYKQYARDNHNLRRAPDFVLFTTPVAVAVLIYSINNNNLEAFLSSLFKVLSYKIPMGPIYIGCFFLSKIAFSNLVATETVKNWLLMGFFTFQVKIWFTSQKPWGYNVSS